ncbi:protein-glutamate methylesterase/protein-glutamine glutaminase [Candidatus Magnetominusculus xianensis]|uniref:Protein-glutamate methylesterase/protein-glutamine glutaminase n=1 Tax=Candidatus Magnetominusculus xianensis TaxID=1748249 RepID=A0ABR5SFL5_9BACT|nr:chemotaxis response regulator protein-glutamate methylesterase [Candidatus Magnetominusculus xianensis]KWT84076.1 chemotaxis response regulator protein-glutamate methylesterase [Candidatus Magnetominusculus xianensis]MBF0402369.1 chemotaxis response regulator protein-glutamate methylesterase [Nitrospirota bacterium]
MDKIKVLIVDDSAFMRNAIKSMVASDNELQVVGVACDGVEAIEKVLTLKPDIVTMDIKMPRMDGLEALEQIMKRCPVAVIMISSLTVEGANTTLKALELGAVDFIPKNLSELSINIMNIKQILTDKLKQIGGKKKKLTDSQFISSIQQIQTPPTTVNQARPVKNIAKNMSSKKIEIVAIGTSTGGPKALQTVIPLLPKDFPVPVVISQHMPATFTGPFAERLNQLSQMQVKEAKQGEKIENGIVYIAPGTGHMSLVKKGADRIVNITDKAGYIYKPSVDVMMLSVAEVNPGACLGVILTGMGNDGLQGMKAIHDSGGRTLAQNEHSCVVYGMPKAVVDAGIADKIAPLIDIAAEIVKSI